MACLIKPPQGIAKGVVSFTTQERDNLIRPFPALSSAVAGLKPRYLIGLHHNWHDTNFRPDPLFDFNMAGEGDLTSSEEFPLLPMDACNFSPPCFAPGGDKFWDVLFVARAVKFKGIPEFFRAVRALYDRGSRLRVLMLCPVPEPGHGTEDGLRQLHEKLFSPLERKLFTFVTLEWDYPFPLDLPTLAHFYRSSRVFVHSAPDERRCRVAAYAWASGVPVVARRCVGSVLPEKFRAPPFFFEYSNYDDFPDAILAALESLAADPDFAPVQRLISQQPASQDLEKALSGLAQKLNVPLSTARINPSGFDLRLGRHHGLATGSNRVEQDLSAFMAVLMQSPDEKLMAFTATDDPELAMAANTPSPPRLVTDQRSPYRIVDMLRNIKRALT